MLKRTLTALLLIPPVVYLIGWSPKWLFVLTVMAAVVLALREYFALCCAMGYKVFSWIGYVAGVVLCAVQALPGRATTSPSFLLAALVLLIPTLAMRPSTDLKDYLAGTSATFSAFCISASHSLTWWRFALSTHSEARGRPEAE